MDILYTILITLATLAVLVGIHEYGHFWVARRCGVKVLRFSIGFGKPFAGWTDKHGTEYSVAAIPLGGYVKMLDEREGEVPEAELDQAFNRKPVLQRIAVVAAGPLANLLLAVVAYWFLFMAGETGYSPVPLPTWPSWKRGRKSWLWMAGKRPPGRRWALRCSTVSATPAPFVSLLSTPDLTWSTSPRRR